MRVAVAHDAHKTGGFGAELAARIMEEAFDYLDAPVERVAALDVPIPCTPGGIAEVYPVRRRCRDRGRRAAPRMTELRLQQLSISMEDGKVLRWLVADGEPVAAGRRARRGRDRQGDDRGRVAGRRHPRDRRAARARSSRSTACSGSSSGRRRAAPRSDGRSRTRRPAGERRRRERPVGQRPPEALRRPGRWPSDRLAGGTPTRTERGIDLTAVSGSGPGGRIVVRDLEAAGRPAARRLRAPAGRAMGSGRRSSATSSRAGSRSRTSTSAASSRPTASSPHAPRPRRQG